VDAREPSRISTLSGLVEWLRITDPRSGFAAAPYVCRGLLWQRGSGDTAFGWTMSFGISIHLVRAKAAWRWNGA